MTDKTKLKETTVKLLKSVVVTKKEGYQVSKLGYGYSQLIGTSIPYKELGYKSIDTFVSSLMEDFVIENEGIAKIIKVKSDKDLAHIERLVPNQMGGNAKSYRSRQLPGINGRNVTHAKN